MSKKLRIKLVRSTIGRQKNQKLNVEALGIHRLNQVVEHSDNPRIRGMINKVSHLVEVEEIEE